MTGLVLLADPPDREHLRLIFHLGGGRGEAHSLLGPARPGRREALVARGVLCIITDRTAWDRTP